MTDDVFLAHSIYDLFKLTLAPDLRSDPVSLFLNIIQNLLKNNLDWNKILVKAYLLIKFI